jgi:hypothetical protein
MYAWTTLWSLTTKMKLLNSNWEKARVHSKKEEMLSAQHEKQSGILAI